MMPLPAEVGVDGCLGVTVTSALIEHSTPPDMDLDNLLSDDAVNNSALFYRTLREQDPVHFNARWNGWVVTRYQDVDAGYKDHARLSSNRFEGPWADHAHSPQEKLFALFNSFFVWKDPPEHTRMRSLVNKAFTPKSVEILRPRIQAILEDLTRDLPTNEPVDFLNGFAFQLPVLVISEYLGVPSSEREDVKVWSEALGSVIFVRGDDTERRAKGESAVEGLDGLLRPIVRARRETPADDLISGMVHATDADGGGLSEDEIIANACLMLFAGHDTTQNLLSNMIVAFHENPDQWRKLQDDPELVRAATEEGLRFDGPITALGRWAREPLEIGNRTIAEGDRVLLVQWAANRDPEVYPDPDRFDIERNPTRHLAFGHGAHVCLGAPLARLEVQEALSHLTTRFDRIEVLNDRLERSPTIVSRSLKDLTVSFHPKS
jgi:cytochrome P450